MADAQETGGADHLAERLRFGKLADRFHEIAVGICVAGDHPTERRNHLEGKHLVEPVEAGYVGGWGENLEIADGRFGAPRVALDGWLNSPGHRENLFRPEWRVHSVYVVKLTDFPGFHDPTLWVSEFGDRW